MADLFVTGGVAVVDGDVLPSATVHVRDGAIADVDVRGTAPPEGAPTVHAAGGYVIPGVIDHHAHGCTTGPLFSSGATPLTRDQALSNADRHITAGVTTLVNVCGFGLPEDVPEHPLQILLGTTHVPHAFAAAELVDGAGLDDRHRAMTPERMLELGAVVIGEVGSGATLGGGVAAYRYVPDAVEAATGTRVDPTTATRLIDALVGPLRTAEPDDAALDHELSAAGFPVSARDAVRQAILRYAAAPVTESLASFSAAAEVSERTGAPAVFHTAEPSVRTVLGLARSTGARIVAGHMNHTSMRPEEAVAFAADLRDEGVVIDVSSLDVVHAQRLATPEVADALASAGLVDTLTTDYAGGAWEPMLALAQRWVDHGLTTVPQVVAMCTSTPARLLGLTDRGELAPGRRADLVITAPNDLSAVRAVVVGGHVVHEAGPPPE